VHVVVDDAGQDVVASGVQSPLGAGQAIVQANFDDGAVFDGEPGAWEFPLRGNQRAVVDDEVYVRQWVPSP